MKKFAIVALAAMAAVVSFSSGADARDRSGNDRFVHEGRNHDNRNGGRNWNDRGFRHDGPRNGWRRDGWNHNNWRHDGWRYGWRRPGYWGGTTVVIAPGYADYCFIRKVRHHDRYGNLYIQRVRVCR